jgi:hypothetical protein
MKTVFTVASVGTAVLLGFAPHAVADDATDNGGIPDYSEHGIFDGFPFVSDDYTPWLNIETPGFNVYGSGVLPWHYGYGINVGDDDFGLTGESIGAVDGLGGTLDLRLGGLEVTNAESYGNWIADPANPDSEGFYCVICNEFQTSFDGQDLTFTLNVFSNALPQFELDFDGERVLGIASSNGEGPASALDPQWWFTPEGFPNLDLVDIFGIK